MQGIWERGFRETRSAKLFSIQSPVTMSAEPLRYVFRVMPKGKSDTRAISPDANSPGLSR